MDLQIHIFTNPVNDKEWVMVSNESLIEGFGFTDYVSTGSRVLTPDTYVPSNQYPHTQLPR